MGEMISHEKVQERAVLVAVSSKEQNRERTEEYLDELEFLLETAGGITVGRFVQALDRPNSVTYLGTGKLEELKQYVKAEEIDMAIFDDMSYFSKTFARYKGLSPNKFRKQNN